jgi:hypothetical protein
VFVLVLVHVGPDDGFTKPKPASSIIKEQKEKLAVTGYLFEEEQICILYLNANWDDEY